MPKKQLTLKPIGFETDYSETQNSCFNESDLILLEFDGLMDKHRKRFGKEIKYKSPQKRDLKNRVVFKMKPSYSQTWITGNGDNLEKAILNCILKVKKSWPPESYKLDRFIRYKRKFRNFLFRN